MLGDGAHGIVRQGVLKSTGRYVVVKQPRADPRSGGDRVMELFTHEAATQVLLGKHPNVVECIGVATDGTGRQPPALVLEHMVR